MAGPLSLERFEQLELRVEQVEQVVREAGQAAANMARLSAKLHRSSRGVQTVAAELAMAATHLEETLKRFA